MSKTTARPRRASFDSVAVSKSYPWDRGPGAEADNTTSGEEKLAKSSPIVRHPAAIKIFEDINLDESYSSTSIRSYWLTHSLNMAMETFFKATPKNFEKRFPMIQHHVNRYAIYRLHESKQIKVSSFSSSSSIRPLATSPNTAVPAIHDGDFVIEFFLPSQEQVSVYVDISLESQSSTWDFYCLEDFHFNHLEKLIFESISTDHLYKNKVFDHTGKFLSLGDLKLADVILDPVIKQEIKTNIVDYVDGDILEIKRINNLPVRRGVIFLGDPGQGKTYISRALLNSLNTTAMVVSGIEDTGTIDDIFNFIQIFDRVILLFEDIDIYLRSREDGGNSVLSTFLNRLDGVDTSTHAVVILTTNDIEFLDKAVRARPGRFDRKIVFKSPSYDIQMSLLKQFCDSRADIDYLTVVEHTHGSSPAHLKEIYITACNLAIEKGNIDENKKAVLTTDLLIAAAKYLKEFARLNKTVGFNSKEE